jgi:hypothetical protein
LINIVPLLAIIALPPRVILRMRLGCRVEVGSLMLWRTSFASLTWLVARQTLWFVESMMVPLSEQTL